MKPEATHLTEAQRCEIIAKLSKPNSEVKSSHTFQRNVNKLLLNVKRKKIHAFVENDST